MALADRVELQTFYCKEGYVYQVPPATTVGHRADTWNVEKWLTEVTVRVVTCQDDCFVRLEDCKTGELFAECPVPKDAPLVTAVEPVIDSSRYFVLRIVDRDMDRHAFIGLGFRERSEASNFNAALYEYLQYLKRKRVAEARRKEFEEREQRASEGSEGAENETLPAVDYSIKPGEKITIKLNVPKQEKEGFLSKGSKLSTHFNLFAGSGDGGAGLALLPPPAPRRATQGEGCGSPAAAAGAAAVLAMCVSPRGSPATGGGHGSGAEGAGGSEAGEASSSEGTEVCRGALPMRQASGTNVGLGETPTEQLQGLQLGPQNGKGSVQQQSIGVEGPHDSAAETEEDDWGDFTSS